LKYIYILIVYIIERPMHELSIAENMLEIIENYRAERGFKHCSSLTVRIGLLSAVDGEALRFAFEILAEGGPHEGVVLEVEKTYPQARCSCGCSFEVTDLLYTCPRCGSVTAELSGGDDLNIVQLEVD